MAGDYLAVGAAPVTQDEWMGDSVLLEFPPLPAASEILELRSRCSLSRSQPTAGEMQSELRASSDHGRWWVSLLSCLGGRADSLDADQWIWVDVEFSQKTGAVTRARFGLRLIGPVTTVEIHEVNSISGAMRWPKASPLGDRPLFTQEVKNLSDRKIEIEVSPPTRASIFTSVDRVIAYGVDTELTPEEEGHIYAQYRSQAEIQFSRVQVGEVNWPLGPSADPSENRPRAVIPGNQTVQVVWFGTPAPSASACSLAPGHVTNLGGSSPPEAGRPVRQAMIKEQVSALNLGWNGGSLITAFPGGLSPTDPDRTRMAFVPTGNEPPTRDGPVLRDYPCQGYFAME